MTSFHSPEAQQRAILDLKPGQVLDGLFAVESVIGAGGQGVVFGVKHLEWNRRFALKLPLPDKVRSPRSRDRFIKEAETWIRMGVHPNIVRCWFVRPVLGLPGLFLDLVPGGSLESYLENRKLLPGQWKEIVVTLLQIVEGLTHSHAKGVVHRDLKPENLLIQANGVVAITDFGLVKTLDEADTEGQLPEGQMGTPRYGAPEQWTDPESVSPVTDIYSFGVIMFEILCGRRPFESQGGRGGPLELINLHITAAPPSPRDLIPNIPEPLVELCLQCLEKEPKDRPQSASDVLERLRAALNEYWGMPYPRPTPVPSGDRPSLLNNAAVSLFSLGRAGQARALLNKGLMLEAGHPQCLYNLVQLDRREAKIDRAEAFLRLKRAKAHLELALLYLEEGMGAKAGEQLARIEEADKTGYVYRTEGDALMYSQRFQPALEAYQRAQALMPGDIASSLRLSLAREHTTKSEGRQLFPSLQACFSGRTTDPDAQVLLTSDGLYLLGVGTREIVVVSTKENRVLESASRPAEARQLRGGYTWGNRMLLQDAGAFEFWQLAPLKLLTREQGSCLAATSDLTKLVLLTGEGVFFYDDTAQARAPLKFPPDTKPSPHVMASFNPDQTGFCLLTPDGRVATINILTVEPLAWPPPHPRVGEILLMKMGAGTLALVYRSGHLECFDFINERKLFEYDLGFVPDTLHYDHSGRVLVASAEIAHTVLDLKGRLLLRGRGPFAVNASATHGMVWSQEVMALYCLAPFQRVRSWTERVPQPRSVHIAGGGGRAVSLDSKGQYQVWEVDEDARVYERNMLVTPGDTYEELIDSYRRYSQHLERSKARFQEKDYPAAYRSLREARSVSGFGQAEEALEMQWQLCEKLQRDDLEGVWERLFIPDVAGFQLSADGRSLVLCRGREIESYEISGARIERTSVYQSPRGLVGGCHLQFRGRPAVALLDRESALTYLDVHSGEVLQRQELGLGRVRGLRMAAGRMLFHTAAGMLVSFDLAAGTLHSSIEVGKKGIEQAFPLSGDKAFLITKREFLLVDLSKLDMAPGLPLDLERLPGGVTFLQDFEGAPLRINGFSDGTLIVSHSKDGRPMLAINQETGAVTAACLDLRAALGVSAGEKGHLTLFGLDTGRVLDRFLAHSDGVAEVTLTENGRYLATRSPHGQFRLWEIFWNLSPQPGPRKIEWLPSQGLAKLGRLFRR